MKKKTAAPSSLKRVKSLKMHCCTESGEWEGQQHTLWLDTRGDASFAMILPDYVATALGIETMVSCATAEAVKKTFEQRMREYHAWYKTAKAEPIIILQVKYLGIGVDGFMIERDSFFIGSERGEATRAVGLSYELAYRVNGHVHAREFRHFDINPNAKWGEPDWGKTRTEEHVGHRISYPRGTILNYTPELHAKLDAICAALNQAAQTLHEICAAKDMAQALMFLGSPSTMLLSNTEQKKADTP